MKMTLRIKPNNLDDGLLLYCGETEEGYGDFVSLAIHNKHLEFRFDAGNGTDFCPIQVSCYSLFVF